MPMNPMDMAEAMYPWIGPTDDGQAAGDSPPIGGFPNEAVGSDEPPEVPEILETQTTALSSGPTELVVSGLEPGAYVDGFCVAGDYVQGVKITANTATGVTLEAPAKNPSSYDEVDLTVADADQRVFELPGYPRAAYLSGVKLVAAPLEPDIGLEADEEHPQHDPRGGVFAVKAADPVLAPGDTVRFKYSPLVTVTARDDEQVEYQLPGAPNVSEVQVVNVFRGGQLIAESAADGEASRLESGVVTIYLPYDDNEEPNLFAGDVVEFQYLLAQTDGVPAGIDAILIPPPPDPPPGADIKITNGEAWAGAYKALIAGGAANGVPASGLDAAESAMAAVIDGMMQTMPFPGLPPLGALALQAGCFTFWGVIAPQFAGAAGPAIPPPGLAALPVAMIAAGVSVKALDPTDVPATPRAAALAQATAVLTASLGGLVPFPTGPAPVPYPFL